MPLRVVLYRLYRLRRLIVLACFVPLAVVAVAALVKGPVALVLAPIAVGAPIAHALAFPRVWTETITVSLTVAVLLALAATIGPEVGLVGLALRIVGLAALGAVLFFVLITRVAQWAERGAPRPMIASARRRSRLDAETLKRAITLYPGRSDGFVTCGTADPDGLFEIRFHHRMASLTGDRDEGTDVVMHGMVFSDTTERFELFCIEEDAAVEARSRFQFRACRGGTVVTLTEKGIPLSSGHRFGFWLTDYMADYLTDEVDRAEGRPMRANRFQVTDQLIVAIARRFFPPPPEPGPAE